jgi:hypothetical protein
MAANNGLFQNVVVEEHYEYLVHELFTHYEKLRPRQLDHPITRAPKQLIYNCIIIVPWKYDKLINKMHVKRLRSCIIVAN